MISRRPFLAGLAVALLAPVAARAETGDPAAFVAGLYDRLAASRRRKEPDFWREPAGRTGVFAKDLVDLWKAAEAKVEDGDVGPIDFDLFFNAQDGRPGKPTLVVVDVDSTKAHVRATLPVAKGKTAGADDTLVFSLVREGGGWRIDNLHGAAGGDPWDLRGLLSLQ
ncbi:DUF3828 domain-containing protein [Siculibacillus lacustris]|uniref:DUF3828 domain-containing protein n=1 Tax=Siculibacillus lacustris TaxID=1549641 RepID=A0A4Q9VJM3_9HYPH|nr:DUF3828 domain-containing protein [Siculibacillus lacustris]TBW34628.1 DUF3828 domain-containing protein [Siculibacillus lacustris]